MHILLIMIDGFGIPPEDYEDSIYAEFPTLLRLLRDCAVPLDACLGMAGKPQSATGQTALFTGINAAAELGEHLPGFPNARLRTIIEHNNIFSKLLAAGRTCTFANAYARGTEANLPLPLRSVTTVATMAAFGQVRNREDLLAGNAVYHDLTREWLNRHAGNVAPIIDEKTAACHLLNIMRTVDFCLFEYFLTDHAAHRANQETQLKVLHSLDRFLQTLTEQLDSDNDLLLVTSDHGNIEDSSQRLHTRNPVPWIALGKNAAAAKAGMRDILDVTPRILQLTRRMVTTTSESPRQCRSTHSRRLHPTIGAG